MQESCAAPTSSSSCASRSDGRIGNHARVLNNDANFPKTGGVSPKREASPVSLYPAREDTHQPPESDTGLARKPSRFEICVRRSEQQSPAAANTRTIWPESKGKPLLFRVVRH